MAMDDRKSIYVGGLPYECTDSQLRHVFELYGSVVSVKIMNDRVVGGKCYGFVTFTNPRSAAEAIKEMDGRTIGGRVVRVNVKNRDADMNMRSNYGRGNIRRNERDLDWAKGRGRERESNYVKGRQRDHSHEHEGERERRYVHTRDRDNIRYPIEARDRDEGSRDVEEREIDYRSSRDREWVRDDDLDANQDRKFAIDDEHDRKDEKNKDQHTKRKNSSSSYDRESREISSESSDYYHQKEEQLGLLIQRREELRKENSDIEHALAEKKELIVDLQKRSLKLEDALTSSKKLSSKRQSQLNKLHKHFQLVKEYGEKLKRSEEDLQDLVNSVSMEIDADDELDTADLYLMNGKV